MEDEIPQTSVAPSNYLSQMLNYVRPTEIGNN